MTSQPIASRSRPRGLLATPSYARLWFAGGVGNAMRWLELLVAGIFTYDATHSAFLVAVVTVTRSLPMLFLGPIAGVIAEALNRKRLLLVQLFGMAATSAVLALLAWSGEIRVWHIALGGAVTGIAWASELAVRRRMLGEVVPADRVVAAVALDSLTNSVAGVLGPLCGGAAFEALGLAGARATPAILGVVLVTIVMNTSGFCYSALIAPIGIDVYRVSPTLVGALAAAEPLGAIIIGVALAAGWLRLNGARSLLQGSFLFLGGVIAMALSPWYGLAFVLLLIGGLGTAAFSNMQTSLILIEAPPATRSRVMGIVTMCIGTGPIGVLMIGALSEQIGPPMAILVMAGIGVAGLSLTARRVLGPRSD